MNQLELNAIAKHFIQRQSFEVAKKLKGFLTEDLKERAEELPGPLVHYIHNMAVFDTLLGINCLFTQKNESETGLQEYLEHAETLRLKFLDIVDSLKDFEPTDSGNQKDN
jgi:hypothetical protein